jgi:hypothetical protein
MLFQRQDFYEKVRFLTLSLRLFRRTVRGLRPLFLLRWCACNRGHIARRRGLAHCAASAMNRFHGCRLQRQPALETAPMCWVEALESINGGSLAKADGWLGIVSMQKLYCLLLNTNAGQRTSHTYGK